MSKINSSQEYTNFYEGQTVTVSVSNVTADYGITAKVGTQMGYTDLTFTGGTQCNGFLNKTPSGSYLTTSLFTSISKSNIEIGQTDIDLYIYSIPLRYVVVYHKDNENNHSIGDGSYNIVFTDNNSTRFTPPITEAKSDNIDTTNPLPDVAERQENQSLNGFPPFEGNPNTTLSSGTMSRETVVSDYTDFGWTLNVGETFSGWTTVRGGNSIDYHAGDKFIYESPNPNAGLLKFNNDIHLYPVISSAADYSITVHFDSNEISSGNISVQANS